MDTQQSISGITDRSDSQRADEITSKATRDITAWEVDKILHKAVLVARDPYLFSDPRIERIRDEAIIEMSPIINNMFIQIKAIIGRDGREITGREADRIGGNEIAPHEAMGSSNIA